jgi:hypothetical protein
MRMVFLLLLDACSSRNCSSMQRMYSGSCSGRMIYCVFFKKRLHICESIFPP